MATTTSKNVLLWTLLGPVTIAGSLGTPVQTIAIKRFTTESNRCASFAASSPLLHKHFPDFTHPGNIASQVQKAVADMLGCSACTPLQQSRLQGKLGSDRLACLCCSMLAGCAWHRGQKMRYIPA